MATDPKQSDELFAPIDARLRDHDRELVVPQPKLFPSPLVTTDDGLVCVGGSLAPEWLLDAYSHGIFPWPVWEDDPMAWWCPDPRAILEFDDFHISRRLARTIRSGKFRVTLDKDFRGVICGCAEAHSRVSLTWLTDAIIDACLVMHELGHAHSVEVWQDKQLVGGTYGVSIGGLFAAESMFHEVSNASKVALAYLVEHLQSRGYQMLDVQQWTKHTGSLGVTEISRKDYLERLAAIVALPVTFVD